MRSKGPRFAAALLGWFAQNGRTLPWRNTTNAYHVLLSEIMLQQTQVSRVLEKFPSFLALFPTLEALANAPQRSVVVAWRGMGYNNRAIRLHRLARLLVRNHSGRVPALFEALIVLPGIGRYTANALLSSVHGKDAAIVDVNVQRVLSRVFWRMPDVAAMQEERNVWMLAEELLPRGNAYRWNQALMDFGALICTARAPACGSCPMARICASVATMKRRTSAPAASEPSLGGVPNRVYRGMIVERLRARNGARRIRLDLLGKSIYTRFTRRHRRWLEQIVLSLERDGLVRLHGAGPFSRRFVSLA